VALTFGLLLCTLLAAAVLLTALVPQRVSVAAASATNVLQVHTVAILGIYPSLALLCWLAPWRSALANRLWRWPWLQALLLLAVAQAVSLNWSPAPLLGVRHLVYMLPLPLAALAFYALSRERPQFALSCLRWLLVGSATAAVLVIAFRLLPSLELAFLGSPLARVFVPPNTLEALFYTSRNNVFDTAKAGGLFVNANIASAYLGMSAIASWYVGRTLRSTTLRSVALLDWTAVLFTGSKAGLLCAAVLPLALAAASAARARRINPLTLFGGSLVAAVAVLVVPLGDELVAEFGSNALATMGSREQIWTYALGLIEQYPLAGLGFGGWEQRFALHAFLTGSATAVPAHNSLFILWLQSGLPGLIAGVLFVGAVYAATARCMRANDTATATLALGVVGAFTWYLAQGLGENFGLIGEVHMTPLLGALLGHLCARYDALEVRHERSEPVRGVAAPSALPAV
jgi:O-antigen ligase